MQKHEILQANIIFCLKVFKFGFGIFEHTDIAKGNPTSKL